jgi:predicted acetyltransferase
MTPDTLDYSVVLRTPDLEMLAQYVAALQSGWSPSTTRDMCAEQLAAINEDPAAFIADVQEREGGTVTLPDGTQAPRVPGPMFWIWDGQFCGQINLRYQPGTLDLPPHVSGHVGYSVVPWKRRRGIASQALQLILPVAAARGLARVCLTCDEDNAPSRRVIERAGGRLTGTEPFLETGVTKLVFWIDTA